MKPEDNYNQPNNMKPEDNYNQPKNIYLTT